MKALFFYQHFWPDSPPYANMLRTITSHFAATGHEISVLTAQPSYKNIDRINKVPSNETLGGVSVKRLPLLPGSRSSNLIKNLSKATWPVRAALHLIFQSMLGRRQEVIVAATIPPVANGLFGLIAAKLSGSKFVYHLQDIYPEIGVVGGLWPEGSTKHKLLRWFDTLVCKQADKCIVLSDDMAKTLLLRGVESKSIVVINNAMLVSFSEPARTESDIKDGAFGKVVRLVFAGNLGRFQGLEAMLEAFLELPAIDSQIELHFVGEGAAEPTLKKMTHGSESVFFHGHRPFESACKLMKTFDAGIVSIQPDIYRFAYPSKTMTYLGLGLPLLAFVESESSLSHSIRNNRLGMSSSNVSQETLQEGFVGIVEYLNTDSNGQQNIKSYVEKNSSAAAVMSQWEILFKTLVDTQASPPERNSTT